MASLKEAWSSRCMKEYQFLIIFLKVSFSGVFMGRLGLV
jgi:hypothetical protein